MDTGNGDSAAILSVVGRTIQRQLPAASDRRSDAAWIQGASITTSICWFLWRSIRSRSHWRALRIAASRGSGRALPISQANADVARLLNVWMDSWTNGPGTDPHLYLNWKITPAFQPLKEKVVGQHGDYVVGGNGDDRRGDADRVHQCGQSAAGTRRFAPARARGTLCAGRWHGGGSRANCCWRA